jgi:tetratricopeptide (TPR) repeat protein
MCKNGDFAKAREFVRQALDINPESGDAYMAALMAECQCSHAEQLGALVTYEPLSQRGNYQKAMRFGDGGLRIRLEGYNARVRENWDEEQRQKPRPVLP